MDAPTSPYLVDVVLAVRDQGRNIGEWVRAVPPRQARTILVVDNGSRDDTAHAARDAGAVVLRETRGGEGAALLRAVAHLTTLPQPPHAVVFAVGDGSADLSNTPDVVRPLVEGHFDLVLGSRALGDAGLPLAERAGAALAHGLIHAIYGHRYSDSGPLRAIRYPALIALGLRDTGGGFWAEMQVKAVRRGLRIAEVAVRPGPGTGDGVAGADEGGRGSGLRGRLEASGRTLYHILRHATAR